MTSFAACAPRGRFVRFCAFAVSLVAISPPSTALGVPGQYLRAIDNPVVNDPLTRSNRFGETLYVSNAQLFVQNRGYSNLALNQGAVHVFNVVTGGLQTTLHNPNPAHDSEFGTAITGNGDTLFIGNSKAGNTRILPAYLYDRQTLQLEQTLNAPRSEEPFFGVPAVSLGNDYLVGSRAVNAQGTSLPGAAYVLDGRNGAMVTEVLNHLGTGVGDSAGGEFPQAFAVSPQKFFIGDSTANQAIYAQGAVYQYDRATGQVDRVFREPFEDFEQTGFGRSLAVLGDRLFVGAPYDGLAFTESGNAHDVGVVYVYSLSTGGLIQKILNPRVGLTGAFGQTLAISGDTLLVGAPSDPDQTGGRVLMFRADTGAFMRVLSRPRGGSDDGFGASIAVGPNYIAVGAPSYSATGAFANRRGAVYLYEGHPAPIPEPLTLALGLVGLAVAGFVRRRRMRTPSRAARQGVA